MSTGLRQKYKVGSIVKIELLDNRIAFGRLLPGVASMICVYDIVISKDSMNIPVDEIVSKPILFCCGLHRAIITKGTFAIIGIKEFTEIEISGLPPSFSQDMVNINDCVIFWPYGGERKATPNECINLERSSVWDEKSLVERIEDHYAGKKNFYVEHQKVILSKDDPRYLAPPQSLRWDFENQKFYRSDK